MNRGLTHPIVPVQQSTNPERLSNNNKVTHICVRRLIRLELAVSGFLSLETVVYVIFFNLYKAYNLGAGRL